MNKKFHNCGEIPPGDPFIALEENTGLFLLCLEPYGDKYEIVYCPWCGKKLEVSDFE